MFCTKTLFDLRPTCLIAKQEKLCYYIATEENQIKKGEPLGSGFSQFEIQKKCRTSIFVSGEKRVFKSQKARLTNDVRYQECTEIALDHQSNDLIGQGLFLFPGRQGRRPMRSAGPTANSLLDWSVIQRIMIVPGNELRQPVQRIFLLSNVCGGVSDSALRGHTRSCLFPNFPV